MKILLIFWFVLSSTILTFCSAISCGIVLSACMCVGAVLACWRDEGRGRLESQLHLQLPQPRPNQVGGLHVALY